MSDTIAERLAAFCCSPSVNPESGSLTFIFITALYKSVKGCKI
ncbi:hypothetical protein HMPREF1548_03482 [Clostridium sp. KLE 1755]|nr:hypothetical protein HMPREF1548_03482 [Clostridium sp. KLE 1755]